MIVRAVERHYVIVGLGNPGLKYENTRHNIGWQAAKALARQLGLSFKEEKRFQALVSKGKYEGTTFHIVLPLTYMNESGKALKAYLDFHKLGTDVLIVISDDVELPFGQLRLRKQGSSGGHNGLKSIEAHLGTRQYVRLKMGIGRDLGVPVLADYVLDSFKPEEKAELDQFITSAVKAVLENEEEDIARKSVERLGANDEPNTTKSL